MNEAHITMAHGGGGRATQNLLDEIIKPAFAKTRGRLNHDGAVVNVPSGRMVVSTDQHVVSPLFFPGGDIGSLAVNGSINDVVVSGGNPQYMTVGLVIEEGMPIVDLQRIIQSMAKVAYENNVCLVAGDTKVVEHGKADGLYINTTVFGETRFSRDITPENIQQGDKIILTGNIAEHGLAILTQREALQFESAISSDTRSLLPLLECVLPYQFAVSCMRDPTRGGIGVALNELACSAGVGMTINETELPLRTEVNNLCNVLGFDPLYVANEGVMLLFVTADFAVDMLQSLQTHPLAEHARIIGEVIEDENNMVDMRTAVGGSRVINWIYDDQLPRIC
jgi:hydrogenase expression/formation protein HypE